MTLFTLLLIGLATALWPARSRPGGLRRPGGGRVGGLTPIASRPTLASVRDRGPRLRDHAATDEVADALVLIGLALRAGLPVVEALHHVRAASTGRVRVELAAVVAALRWGRPAHEAWSYAGPGWRAAALATQMSEQTGAAPAALIERAAERLRDERERERERAAARAGVLLVLPLGLGFLPAFACTAVVPVVLNLGAGILSGGQ